MADYFEEMSWTPVESGRRDDDLLSLARSLSTILYPDSIPTPWPSLPPPASRAVLERLERVIAENNNYCPICLKAFTCGETLIKMPCAHLYHSSCILRWLNKTNSCPMCRFELPTDCVMYENYKREQIRAKEREKELKVLHNSMFI